MGVGQLTTGGGLGVGGLLHAGGLTGSGFLGPHPRAGSLMI